MLEIPDSIVESHSDPEGYDVALVCLNGHIINPMATGSPKLNKEYCPDCGERTIWLCESCRRRPIQGAPNAGSELFTEPPPPAYCHECGKPHPWTKRRLDAARTDLEEAEGITAEDRMKLIESLPDLATETPRTDLAISRFKRVAAKLSGEALSVVRKVGLMVASKLISERLGF